MAIFTHSLAVVFLCMLEYVCVECASCQLLAASIARPLLMSLLITLATGHARRGIFMEGMNRLLLVTHSAYAAADAAQELVSFLVSPMVQLAVWEISSWENIVALVHCNVAHVLQCEASPSHA